MTQTTIRFIDIDGLSLRVGVRPGKEPALLIFNGIGANLELLEPLSDALDGVATITFDVPGSGQSEPGLKPYRLRGLARLAARVLDETGHTGRVDVLGVSWGGALAQQFALTCRARCRKLVLVSTTPGMFMVPGSPRAMARLFNPRRYKDPSHLERVAPHIYGGEVRRDPALIRAFGARSMSPHWLGYLYQQIAFWGWSSLPWLRLLPQPTLILAGNDDPLVPLVNARILARLIPRAQLEVVDDGHLFLLSNPGRVAPSILRFLAAA
ncbi:poly(3-hydroxyalkanoate) depolymerase [Ramlibacter sp. WS9]|uniref:poly(3-hydroxyalkanoate) depolymerase n=1 Tax=Ramlibacter sp. WS9 TaxID=1882741 RepID=UPI001141EFEB|nr:poly(3-hydroxyalkanoate) depolymerase [Ramlibacter sp. WS9]ROZ75083.1 poly(3-hydroxyalkanoate) depolymerase [Ramlibacter sp. WS9]